MIRLVVVDVDGCLTPGEAQPWDFDVLQFIASLNQKARRDASQFAVTLCTGRQEPYVEALMQAIDAHMPAIYENGGGLYFPRPYRFVENPSITNAMRAKLTQAREIITRDLVERGIAQIQPGKQVSMTLYPTREGISHEEIARHARRALDGALNDFVVGATVSSVDILPRGIDKAAGVEWLARETNIPLANIAGIGDAQNDVAFLQRVGFSAAPANAVPEVKSIVQHVSQFENGKGVVDILKRWLGT